MAAEGRFSQGCRCSFWLQTHCPIGVLANADLLWRRSLGGLFILH